MNDISEIVETLFQEIENLVPIIGDEMFVVSHEGEETPLQSYMVDYFESKNKIYFQGDDEEIFESKDLFLQEMKSQGYHGMTILCNHNTAPNTKKNAFKKEISEFYKTYRDKIHLNKTVKNFLYAANYPLIITTSPFDTIERELNYDYSNSIFYDVSCGNDDEIIEANRCVYHLFGPNKKKGSSINHATSLINGDYVTNEKELLRFLQTINRIPPTQLIKYLKDKYLLVLGCCLPNWFFRFLLYPMNSASEVYLVNNEVTSKQLDYYLSSVGYSKLCDVDKVLGALNKKLESAQEDNYEIDVFLSISNEDAEPAEKFKSMLESDFHIKVWLYTEEIITGKWPSVIAKAFNRSRFFMPYITESYLEKLMNNGSGLYRCLEEIALPRISKEANKGNIDFVQPVLKMGTKFRNREVTVKLLNEDLGDNAFFKFSDLFKDQQFFSYREEMDDSMPLKDRLGLMDYDSLKKLFNN